MKIIADIGITLVGQSAITAGLALSAHVMRLAIDY